MLIRMETSNDHEQVNHVIKNAFEVAEHSDGNEHNLVVALRKSDAFIPQLSLVAEMDNEIAGYILFTKIFIGDNVGLALAPLAVNIKYQRQGIGAKLINEGHRIAKDMGFKYIVVLGIETYYPKFGYNPAINLGIKAPFEVPNENFMAIDLTGENTKIDGIVSYAKEFGIS